MPDKRARDKVFDVTVKKMRDDLTGQWADLVAQRQQQIEELANVRVLAGRMAWWLDCIQCVGLTECPSCGELMTQGHIGRKCCVEETIGPFLGRGSADDA